MNPLFSQMQPNAGNNIMQRVQQLKQQMGGDPREHIQRMLNSGQVTQEQYNRAIQQAQSLRGMLGK